MGLDYARCKPSGKDCANASGYEYEGVFAFPGPNGKFVDRIVYEEAASFALSFGLTVLGGGWCDSAGPKSACAFRYANMVRNFSMAFYALSIPRQLLADVKANVYIPELPLQFAYWGKYENFHPRSSFQSKGCTKEGADFVNMLLTTYAHVVMVPAAIPEDGQGGDVIQD